MRFADRRDAGRRLGREVAAAHPPHPVVLALPRGGVAVGDEVARCLDAPLDVIVVRKLGVPAHRELAMGAIGEDGVRVVDDRVVDEARVSEHTFAAVERRQRVLLEQRLAGLRARQPRLDLEGRTAVVVDDGVATGSTATAACRVARAHGAQRVVLAVPVGAPGSLSALAAVADEVICLAAPPEFEAVGQWYRDFSAVTEADVDALLAGARARVAPLDPVVPGGAVTAREVLLPLGDVDLPGRLDVPADTRGIVVFAHGSGSSRHSPRNRLVAEVLQRAGVATLLFDLLSEAEEAHRANVFDIARLGDRLCRATQWVHRRPELAGIGVGYFGASTGAAAALWAAADPSVHIDAIVARGGRPDLAGPRLAAVRAPTLLIVGGEDAEVLGLNRWAATQLRCEQTLAIVPGATHLFTEPGTLDRAAALATEWFVRHLTPAARRTGGPVLDELPGRRR